MTITCADCGLMQTIPQLQIGAVAECSRCDRLLQRRASNGFDLSLACSIAVFLLLPPAVFMPLLSSTIRNLVFQQTRLVSSVGVIYKEVWFPFAFGFLFLAVVFPAMRAFLQAVVLFSLRMRWKVWQRGRLFRWSEELRIWCMTDVVAIAGIVAYFRAAIPADVEIQIGAWSYLSVAVIAAVGDRYLDRRAIWAGIRPDLVRRPDHRVASCDVCELSVPDRRSGDPCPRCGATLDRPVPPQFFPAFTAILASLPLCIPSYAAAVMVNDQLTGVLEHTVIGTVQLMADRGYWQFGVIVLVTGVAIPVVEIIGLSWLLARVRFPKKPGLVLRTRVYRLLHRLVRWPMIMPFIAAIAAPIVDFEGIDDIVAGPGATPLFMLIVLLMLAMHLFHPRLMWKMTGEAR